MCLPKTRQLIIAPYFYVQCLLSEALIKNDYFSYYNKKSFCHNWKKDEDSFLLRKIKVHFLPVKGMVEKIGI